MTKCLHFLFDIAFPTFHRVNLQKSFTKNILALCLTWFFGLLTLLASITWAYFRSQLHYADNLVNASIVNEVQTYRIHAPYRHHLLNPQVYVYQSYFSKYETSLQTGSKTSGTVYCISRFSTCNNIVLINVILVQP